MPNSHTNLSPYFIESEGGRILINAFLSVRASDNASYIVFVPPFAEESNKSRRMLSRQARLLNSLGYHVVLPDLYGTGDSEGDFSEASWEIWRQNLKSLANDLNEKKKSIVAILGLRMGALLAINSLQFFDVNLKRLVLWQPLVKGDSGITQFLRIRMAADVASNLEKCTPKTMREQLSAGDMVEVAGYFLNPLLVSAIDALKMEELNFPADLIIDWFEVVATEGRSISPVSEKNIENLRAKKNDVRSHCVVGPAFWNSVEIEEASILLDKTTEIFEV